MWLQNSVPHRKDTGRNSMSCLERADRAGSICLQAFATMPTLLITALSVFAGCVKARHVPTADKPSWTAQQSYAQNGGGFHKHAL